MNTYDQTVSAIRKAYGPEIRIEHVDRLRLCGRRKPWIRTLEIKKLPVDGAGRIEITLADVKSRKGNIRQEIFTNFVIRPTRDGSRFKAAPRKPRKS